MRRKVHPGLFVGNCFHKASLLNSQKITKPFIKMSLFTVSTHILYRYAMCHFLHYMHSIFIFNYCFFVDIHHIL